MAFGYSSVKRFLVDENLNHVKWIDLNGAFVFKVLVSEDFV